MASSPRAIGPVARAVARAAPVGRGGPDEGRERGAVDPGRGGQARGRDLEGDEEVGGHRGRGVVGGPVLVGHLDGVHAEAAGEVAGAAPGPLGSTRHGTAGAGESAPSPVTVISGCRREGLVAGQDVEPGGARAVADERARRGPSAAASAIAASGTVSRTASTPVAGGAPARAGR